MAFKFFIPKQQPLPQIGLTPGEAINLGLRAQGLRQQAQQAEQAQRAQRALAAQRAAEFGLAQRKQQFSEAKDIAAFGQKERAAITKRDLDKSKLELEQNKFNLAITKAAQEKSKENARRTELEELQSIRDIQSAAISQARDMDPITAVKFLRSNISNLPGVDNAAVLANISNYENIIARGQLAAGTPDIVEGPISPQAQQEALLAAQKLGLSDEEAIATGVAPRAEPAETTAEKALRAKLKILKEEGATRDEIFQFLGARIKPEKAPSPDKKDIRDKERAENIKNNLIAIIEDLASKGIDPEDDRGFVAAKNKLIEFGIPYQEVREKLKQSLPETLFQKFEAFLARQGIGKFEKGSPDKNTDQDMMQKLMSDLGL